MLRRPGGGGDAPASGEGRGPFASGAPRDGSAPAPAEPAFDGTLAVLLLVALPLVAVELVLWAADGGVLGSRRWRGWAVENAGFWIGLLRDWQPNWPGQPLAMFATYSLVHADPGHMLGNVGALAWLGPPLARRLGAARFALVWLLCAVAGGAAFALLAQTPQPMVGASGAVFGLLGADAATRHRLAPSARRLGGVVILFVVLNVLSLALQGGLLAWQAHLGGFAAGLALGAALRLRGEGPPP